MNDKLLRAFIEAQGYEIEEISCRDLVGIPFKSENPPTTLPKGHVWEFIGCGKYQIHREYVDYKVTKKKVIKIGGRGSSKAPLAMSIFMGNWKGTDIFVQTGQEDELREMLLYTGKLNENI